MALKKRLFSLLVFSICFELGSLQSFAYIPPSQFILKTWVNKHSGARSYRIKTIVTAFQNEKPTEYHFKETTLVNLDNQTLKSWATDDQDHKLFVIEKSWPSISPMTKLLVSPHLNEVTQVLKKIEIPIRSKEELLQLRTEVEKNNSEVVSLSRLTQGNNHAVAWVIGHMDSKTSKNSPDFKEPRSQMWIEKDTFLPLRLIFENSEDRELLDFRFDTFRYFRDVPYPRNISVSKKSGALLLTSQLSELAVNADSSKSFHMNRGDSGFTPQGEAAPAGLKDLIRFYYAVVR